MTAICGITVVSCGYLLGVGAFLCVCLTQLSPLSCRIDQGARELLLRPLLRSTDVVVHDQQCVVPARIELLAKPRLVLN
jgi:hypothetical protein